LDIKVDRVAASLEGMDAESVSKTLTTCLEGTVTTQVQRGPKMVGVRVWIPQGYRSREKSIGELQLRAPDGHMVPSARIAKVIPITGQPQIKRDDLKRMIAVTGRISGRDMGSTIRDIKDVLAQPGLLPGNLYYRLGGLYEQQQIAFKGLLLVLAAAVVLVFLLLLFMYERFRVAWAMLLTTLLATAAVFIGLWLTGTELNITSMMGLTMVVGIVTEVGIFYFSEYRDLPEQADEHERFILAGLNRMRPIAMTTLAAILALLPLALGLGQGSSMERPLAIAIIAGLMAQLPLALIVQPALLRILRVR
jgi:multidrug efflux pump subunit AcrB